MFLTAKNGVKGATLVLLGASLGVLNLQCGAPERLTHRPGTPGQGGATAAGAAGTGAAGTSATGAAGDALPTGAGGDTGAAGTVAAAGTNGAAGTVAAAGTNGAAGTVAAAGTNGAAGTVAAAGTNGAAGTVAAAGTNGAAGTVAAAGTNGAAGTAAAGTSGGAGTAAVNGCLNANWTFTPNFICDFPANASCNFATTARLPANAIDGDVTTRYTSGKTQAGDEFFVLSFAGRVKITGITVMTSTATDYMRGYRAEFSATDGTTFTPFAPVLMGTGSANLTITFPAATTMKAIKIYQTGMVVAPATSWWSIHEITLVGCVQQ